MTSSVKPLIEDWMTEEEVNFRQTAHQVITQLPQYCREINDYSLLKYFPTGGFSQSLVALAEVNGNQRIIKTARWAQNIKREAKFLKAWKAQVVPVPKIYWIIETKSEDFGTIAITVMEFIPQENAFEQLKRLPVSEHVKSWQQIGNFLAKLHQTTASGFGKPMPPEFMTGKYSTFGEFVVDNLISEKDKAQLLQNKYDLSTLEEAIRIVDSCGESPCLSHHDLGLHNVLGINEDMIVFDPDPTIDYSYIDLATSYIFAVTQSDKTCAEEMLNSYISSSQNSRFNKEVFKKALLIRLLSKHARWLRDRSTDRDRKSLQVTKGLLGELVS